MEFSLKRRHECHHSTNVYNKSFLINFVLGCVFVLSSNSLLK
uniref:Uncharacterized protein n=1 Tax=Anguilla anguilla TaxID=7936 RepID=A0A0E9WJZ7_ANGAN